MNFQHRSKTLLFKMNQSTLKTLAGKLLFIPKVSTTQSSTKSLRYNGHLFWNNFCRSISNINFHNVGITKFKKFLKDY